MANLTEKERDALYAIDCSGSTNYDVIKALALMGFIYMLIGILITKGLNG